MFVCTCTSTVRSYFSSARTHRRPRRSPSRPARFKAKSPTRSGGVLPGVTVEARSNVLPGPRVTVTGADGIYQLPALPPGSYTLTFTLSGMQTVTKKVNVQLSEITAADAALGVGGVSETVTVTAQTSLRRQDVGGDHERHLQPSRSASCRSARSTAI